MAKNNKSDVDDELMKEILGDQEKAGGSKTPTYKVPGDGKDHAIRILPGFFGKTKRRWYEPVTQHWGPDPTGRTTYNSSWVCPKEHFGEACPFCDAWTEAKTKERQLEEDLAACEDADTREKLDKKLKSIKSKVKDLSFRRTYLLNVVNREEQTPVSRVFFAPKTVWDLFVGAYTNNAEGGDIFDAEEGHDFTIRRTTADKRTEYKATCKIKPSPIHDDPDVTNRLMSGRVDLPKEYVTRPDAAEMRDSVTLILSGKGASTQTKRDRPAEEPAPPPRAARPPRPVEDPPDDIPMDHPPKRTTAAGAAARVSLLDEDDDEAPGEAAENLLARFKDDDEE